MTITRSRSSRSGKEGFSNGVSLYRCRISAFPETVLVAPDGAEFAILEKQCIHAFRSLSLFPLFDHKSFPIQHTASCTSPFAIAGTLSSLTD